MATTAKKPTDEMESSTKLYVFAAVAFCVLVACAFLTIFKIADSLKPQPVSSSTGYTNQVHVNDVWVKKEGFGGSVTNVVTKIVEGCVIYENIQYLIQSFRYYNPQFASLEDFRKDSTKIGGIELIEQLKREEKLERRFSHIEARLEKAEHNCVWLIATNFCNTNTFSK